MEEMSQKVQNASSYPIILRTHKGTQSIQWGDGTLHMGLIRGKAHVLPQTHMATVNTPMGRWRKGPGRFNTQAYTLDAAFA